MKFKKNVISNIVLHVITIAVGFFTSILIARGLGTENQGQLSYYVLIFGIIASYGNLGITSSTSYFLKKTEYNNEQIINNNISVLLILSIVYAIGVIIFKNYIFTSYIYLLAIIWISYAIILLFNNFLTTIYMSDENIYIYNKFFTICYILKGIVIIVLFLINKLSILNISILYLALEIMKIILLLRGLKLKYRFEINKKILFEELKYGIPLYLAGLFIYLNYRADQLMVRNALGNSQLGIYSISVQLAELAFIFPTSIASAFEGRLYSCEEKDKKKIAAQIIRITIYITLIICIIGVFCRPLITILYGEEYAGAATAMTILLIGIVFASIGKVSPAYFYTRGKPTIHLIVAAIVLLINVVLNLIFIPSIGINGAALASTISYIFYGVIYIIMFKREGIHIRQLLILQKEDIKSIKNLLPKTIKKEGNV